MTRYAITGTPGLSPDCMTPDTGESVGEANGRNYWNVGSGWFLTVFGYGDDVPNWGITHTPGGMDEYGLWIGPTSENPVGEYIPNSGPSGTVTVAEYVEPVVPHLSARLMLVIQSLNGEPPPPRIDIPLSEIRS